MDKVQRKMLERGIKIPEELKAVKNDEED